mgnify:CR=1 FL=1
MEKSGAASKFLSFLGRYSFEIMAIHFAVFKFVDYAYAKFWLRSVPENLAGFPTGFSHELWPLYLIAGTLIPAFIGWVSTRISRFLFFNRFIIFFFKPGDVGLGDTEEVGYLLLCHLILILRSQTEAQLHNFLFSRIQPAYSRV